MFRGALFATRVEARGNPDWMAQAANSLREILYPFWGQGLVPDRKMRAFQNTGSVRADEAANREVSRIYGSLNELAHHGNSAGTSVDFAIFGPADFERLMADFERIMLDRLMHQLDIHGEIDLILGDGPEKLSILGEESEALERKPGSTNTGQKTRFTAARVRELIRLNFDSRQYFYAKADERWLGWLWKSGLLGAIKEKPADPMKRTYRMPELDYLDNMVDKDTATVVDIMLEVPCLPGSVDPQVVQRFQWICSKLPADQLARIVPKIRDESWVRVLNFFNDMGFEHEKMLATLSTAKDYENVILLAEAIVSVRTKDEFEKDTNRTSDSPFSLNRLEHTKVFEYLATVDDAHAQAALAVAVKSISAVVLLGGENNEDRIFPIKDTFYLFDVDFFTLKLGGGPHYSPQDDIRELAAVVTTLATRILDGKCGDETFVRQVYERFLKPVPESWSMWRLRLYVLSLCPKVFAREIREEIFRVFKYETSGLILSGAEYERLLQAAFGSLADADQREFVAKVMERFSKQEWLYSGRAILSCVISHLTKDEMKAAEEAFGPLVVGYVPRPSVGESYGGMIVSQAPGEDEDWKKPVSEIVNRLRTDWSPTALKEKYENEREFLRPHDATGVAERLKHEMAARPAEFLKHAALFFDQSNLDTHYTYAFLQSLSDLAREKKISEGADFGGVFVLMNAIATSAPSEKKPADRKRLGLAHWDSVHNAMADLLKELLGASKKPLVDFKANRDVFFGLIKYLLAQGDPSPKDEELDTARFTTTLAGTKHAMVSDPFSIAINSVRGRVFQALVAFVYRDAELFPKEEASKVASDTKALYEETLRRETTRAIMFMFGHFLPPFYFRDKKWVRELLPQIFPSIPEKQHLYAAAWEGYLANNLYEEMFFDPGIQKLYERGIARNVMKDPTRKQFKDPDETLPDHLALAFVYYKDFGFDHPLFKEFWRIHPHRHAEFAGFLGRLFVSGRNTNADEFLKTEPRAKARLMKFWDWVLEHQKDEALLVTFGSWISTDKGLFEPLWLADRVKRTLQMTHGRLEWGYGLTRSIVSLAQAAPEDTLAILKFYMLEGMVRGTQKLVPFYLDEQLLAAYRTLYANPLTKKTTYTLIDDLVREGGSPFWMLKEVLI
jgi:hypothetical protein